MNKINADVEKRNAMAEEEKNLDRTKKKLRELAAEEKKNMNFQQEEIDRISDSNDKSSYEGKMSAKGSYAAAEKDFKFYNEKIKDPYFARVDILEDGEYKTYFFGNDTILSKNGDILVNNILDKFGEIYRNSGKTEFKINEETVTVNLRRAIKIENAELVDVDTLYDSANELFKDGVVDEFLLSILRDNRRNYKLNDILKTINTRQNEIMTRPQNESFIVQGCAGSGKSMILLHRLAYLAYNFKNINFDRYCIITPNENFNKYIGDLCSVLKIKNIKRYTTESFYITVIKNISKGKDANKLTKEINKKTESEKLLNNDLLKELYSASFFESFINEYNKIWDDSLKCIRDSGIEKLFKNKSKNIEANTYLTYNYFNNEIRNLANDFSEKQKAYDNALEEINLINLRIASDEPKLTHSKKSVDLSKEKLLNQLEIEKEKIKIKKEGLLKEITLCNEKIENLIKNKNEISIDNYDEICESLTIIEKNHDNLTDFKFLLESSSDIAKHIKEEAKKEFDTIVDLSAQLKIIPFYNFRKKVRINNEIKSLANEIEKTAESLINNYVIVNNETIKAYDNNIRKAEKEIKEAEKLLEFLQNSLTHCSDLFDLYSAYGKSFSGSEYPKIEIKGGSDNLSSYVNDYSDALFSYKKLEKINNSLRKSKGNYEAIIERFESISNIATPEKIIDIQNKIETLSGDSFFDYTEKVLTETYKKYNQKYNSNKIYRHILYIDLLLCTLYYGGANNIGYYLNIDEAQDFSITEYRLLKMCLGDKTVFNLYGDKHQLIYNYKGINNWSEIGDVITSNLYILEQNYRNTCQITDYCNREFKKTITPIGLSGENVINNSFKCATEKIISLHSQNPRFKIAVIYKKELGNISEYFPEFDMSVFSFGEVESDNISVITVEESKGLEFNAVMVINNEMTINEKYIACTRALDNLIITEK